MSPTLSLMDYMGKKVMDRKSWLFLILLLTGSFTFFNTFVETAFLYINRSILVIVSLLLGYEYIESRKSKESILLLLSLSLFWVAEITHNEKVTIASMFSILLLLVFCDQNDIVHLKLYSFCRIIIVIMSFFGILAYMSFALGLRSPISIEEFYEEGSQNIYYNYGLSILLVSSGSFLARLCGLFNEPGMFGTICALILAAEKMNFRRFGNIIIIIAAFFAFSLGFFLTVVIYFFLDALLNKKKISIIITVAVIASYSTLSLAQTGNDDLDRLFSGLAIGDNHRLIGDDRTSAEFDALWKEFNSDPAKLLFGVKLPPDLHESSIKTYLANYGVILFFLIYFPLVLYLYFISKGNRYAWILSLCFLINTYQRPLVFTLLYFTILIGGIKSILNNKEVNYESSNIRQSHYLWGRRKNV